MNVKEAIGFAKQHARDVFDKESMSDLGVEEVERDGDYWRITLGLSRPWDRTRPAFAAIIGKKSLRIGVTTSLLCRIKMAL